MKTLFNNLQNMLLLTFAIGVLSCSNNDEPVLNGTSSNLKTSSALKTNEEKVNVFKGPEVSFGKGKARSLMSLDKDGFPLEIAIEFTPDVLSDLSKLQGDDHNGSEGDQAVVLPLHMKAKEVTPFEHIGLNELHWDKLSQLLQNE